MDRLAPALTLLLLAGCVGGEPRRVEQRGGGPFGAPVERAGDRRAVEGDPIDAYLPRSGDPARPNVKVEVQTVDLVSSEGLRVRGGVRGSIVRGVVDLRASASGGAGSLRARNQTTTFVVVQAGSEGSIQLSAAARGLCGYAGLRVRVVSADARTGEAEVALAPYVHPSAVRGQTVSGANRVRVRSGEALVIGGITSSEAHESRGIGRYSERRGSRRLMVLVKVDVLG